MAGYFIFNEEWSGDGYTALWLKSDGEWTTLLEDAMIVSREKLKEYGRTYDKASAIPVGEALKMASIVEYDRALSCKAKVRL